MTAAYTLGILQTGHLAVELADIFPTYAQMCTALVAATAPQDWDYRTYVAVDGELPASPTECDAWMFTGSKFGVYEDYPWIHALIGFVRSAYAAGTPMVGICFGHQLLAQALGGEVIETDKGWGVGTHDYQWTEHKPDWLAGTELEQAKAFAIQAFHQDQIVVLPPDARVLAQNDFCPNSVLAYGEQVISFQGHPEFSTDFMDELIELRRFDQLGPVLADEAKESLKRPLDRAAIGAGIANFLLAHTAKKVDKQKI